MVIVRSQDKERLILANALDCTENNTYEGIKSYNINTWVDNCLAFQLGNYATKERALEVLDEIQQFIDRDGEMNGKYRVFPMPLE
jgi:hypothetical protein